MDTFDYLNFWNTENLKEIAFKMFWFNVDNLTNSNGFSTETINSIDVNNDNDKEFNNLDLITNDFKIIDSHNHNLQNNRDKDINERLSLERDRKILKLIKRNR